MDGDEALSLLLCKTLIELVRTVSNCGKNKMKTFIVKKTMPTYVTVSFEIEAKNEKEAHDKFMRGQYNHNPVGPVEIGATLKVEPKIEVKEKDE
jgi:hypothetical protein